jgi:hypothetical protein
VVLKPAIQTLCYAWEEREIWTKFERERPISMVHGGVNTGKHLYFPNVLIVCKICSQILWNYVKFETKNGYFSVVYSWCYIFMLQCMMHISKTMPYSDLCAIRAKYLMVNLLKIFMLIEWSVNSHCTWI